MISVLLIILKIIGITLLIIIGLILLMLLLVLFVPVRYRFKGSYNEKFLCKGKITWLLHLVSVAIDVEEKAVVSIRILGIPLSLFMKKKETVVETVADKTESVVNQAESTVQSEADQGVTVDETVDKDTNSDTLTEDQKIQAQTIEDSLNVELEDTADGQSKKQNFITKISLKIQELWQKIKDILVKIQDIFKKIKDVLANIKEKKDTLKRYLAILKSDTTKSAFAVCKNRLFRMVKHIFPRKVRVNVTYGMSDPADTGYVLAVYGMLPVFLGKSISLHPDFEQQIFNGDFYIKGAIRAGTLLYQVLRVLLDKDCQKLYHIVKKEISNEHK